MIAVIIGFAIGFGIVAVISGLFLWACLRFINRDIFPKR